MSSVTPPPTLLSDADIDRLLGYAAPPPASPDFVDRIVAAAASERQIGARLRRPGRNLEGFRRAAVRGAIVFAVAAATAAAAALTAVQGDLRRLPDLPAMVFRTWRRPTSIGHAPTPINVGAEPRALSPSPPKPTLPKPSSSAPRQIQVRPALSPLQGGRERKVGSRVPRERTMRGMTIAHPPREHLQDKPREPVRDDVHAKEQSRDRLAAGAEAKQPALAGARESLVNDRPSRAIASPSLQPEPAIGDRTNPPGNDVASDPRPRSPDRDKKPANRFRRGAWRRPFGRMGRF